MRANGKKSTEVDWWEIEFDRSFFSNYLDRIRSS